MRYAVVIERAGDNYSAFVPDLPGCVATSTTIADVRCTIAEAFGFLISGLRKDGEPVPAPTNPVDPRQERPAADTENPFGTFTE